MKKEEITKEIKEVVIARLETMPANKKISVGSQGEFTKEELIDSVKKGNEIGEKIIEIEWEFLKAFKKGIVPQLA